MRPAPVKCWEELPHTRIPMMSAGSYGWVLMAIVSFPIGLQLKPIGTVIEPIGKD